jgi:hypothetical protein
MAVEHMCVSWLERRSENKVLVGSLPSIHDEHSLIVVSRQFFSWCGPPLDDLGDTAVFLSVVFWATARSVQSCSALSTFMAVGYYLSLLNLLFLSLPLRSSFLFWCYTYATLSSLVSVYLRLCSYLENVDLRS